jgi:hypothetical protein
VLVAFKVGTTWNAMRDTLDRVQGALGAALPNYGVTSVEFAQAFAFEPWRTQRIGFQNVLAPAQSPLDVLRRDPNVAAAEYELDLRAGSWLDVSPFEPPNFDDAGQSAIGVRPAVAFANEEVGLAIRRPVGDECAFWPHLLPQRPEESIRRFVIEARPIAPRKCRIDQASPDTADAAATRVLVPLGRLPAGDYEAVVGAQRTLFSVLPQAGFGPELDPETAIRLEVARTYWPQSCPGAAAELEPASPASRKLADLLAQRFPQLNRANLETLSRRAADLRIRRDGPAFVFTLGERPCGDGRPLQFEGRVTVEVGTETRALQVGPLSLAASGER